MSRRWCAAACAVLPLLIVAACGTASAPGTGSTSPLPATSGTVRPVTGQPRAADGALECPATIPSAEGMTVPEKPQGVDGNARLLPERAAASMVVCGYPVMDIMATKPLTAPFPLSARTVPTAAQRTEVTELLAWAPRWNGKPKVCTMMAGNETAYLVGSVYDGAIVWVAAKADANSCSNSTNGDFVSGAALGVVLHAMFGGGQPQPTSPPGPCSAASFGRLGDDQSLAPEGDPAVTVCRLAADSSWHATALDAGHSAEVVQELRGLRTRPTGQTCEGSGKASDSRFTLWLAYDAGPRVRVSVDPECAPEVLGSSLEAEDAGSLVSLVEQWSAPIPGPDPNGSVSSGSAGQ